jgi:HD-like signal output (HDOD) protein
MDKSNAKNIILEKVERLPSLPDIVTKVLSLVEDEGSSIREVGNLISRDYAISSQLLKIVNSTFYGLKEKVSTVQHATVIVGLQQVKSLVLAIAAFKTLHETKSQTSLSREGLWKHSLKSSLVGHIISQAVGGVNPETTLTASLLHDIGKLVLDSFFSSEYEKVLEQVRTQGISMVEAEEEILGFTHADTGGWLCEGWSFSPILVVPILFHHRVEQASEEHIRMTAIVHLADILSKHQEIEKREDKQPRTSQLAAQKQLKLQSDDLDKIIEHLKEEEEKIKSFIGSIN